MRTIVLLLGDQLSRRMSSLRDADKDSFTVLMAEVMEEATYVKHHKKKIAFVFAAMRHFAEELREEGWDVDYVKLDDDGNAGSLFRQLERACERHEPDTVIVTEPGEYRLASDMRKWEERLGITVRIRPDERFIASRKEFSAWAEGRKELRMEYFYREMRRKTGLLMDGDEPEGGQWNFDAQNRKPASPDLEIEPPPRFDPDDLTRQVIERVAETFPDHFGDLEPFWFAVSRDQAQEALDHFIEESLPRFGDYQDAMLRDEAFLYHSVLSLYINAGLLDPLQVCREAETAYRTGKAPLNAVEGFIRQIIGWREFMRGIYWLRMPGYADLNYLGADRPLPDFYWTGDCEMACLRAAIGQTRTHAYAHHIQRLMVTGNFALLIGADPRQVHEWYLRVYADAYEWVELPNTLGMSQFADGGIVASKPYAAGGNYIKKMSNYCEECTFDVRKKTGGDACPFNYLYWDFVARNAGSLKDNPRMGNVYATWNRMAEETKKAHRDSAQAFLKKLQ